MSASAGSVAPERTYLPLLLGSEALLVILHFTLGEHRLFNLDREHNLPTWFSGVQLAAIGALCAVAYHRERAGARLRWMWWVFATGFFYLSFDEIMVVHEGFLREETLDALPGASLWRALPPWQIVFAPAGLAAAIGIAFFFRSRFAARADCWGPGLAGMALWGVAFALEGTATAVFIPRGWYPLEVALEEVSEMVGATLMLLAVGRYVASPGERAEVSRAKVPRRRMAFAAAILVFILIPAGAILFTSLREASVVQIEAGNRLLSEGDYERAMGAFSAVLARQPENVEALWGLGTAAYRSGDLEKAERVFIRAHALSPRDEKLRNALDLVRVRRSRAPGAREPTSALDPGPNVPKKQRR